MNVTETNGAVAQKPDRPPDDVVSDILSLPHYELPELRTITGSPVLLPDARFLVNDGYDMESGIYAYLNGLGGRLHFDRPLNQCLDIIRGDLLVDFPFSDEGSWAHALALLLQAFVRPYISGPTPMFLVDAPTRGTGKGLLADVIAILALGRPAWVMAQPKDEDEVRKRITSMLMTGSPMILLDNVYRLDSAALCAVLTTTQWRDRLLGQSRMVEVPNHATWIATGNNVSLSDEMVRRVVSTRLDAVVERPEDRTNFKHEDLLDWAREHRAELVSACLSIINHWVSKGMPKGAASLGRFEGWAGVMGGILEVAGIPGFLSNRDRMYADADVQNQEWAMFCEAWHEVHGQRPVTAKSLFLVAKNQSLLLDVWANKSALAAQQRIGHALASHRDRIYGRWAIRSAGRDSQTKSMAYRLEPVTQRDPEQNPRNPANPLAPEYDETQPSGVLDENPRNSHQNPRSMSSVDMGQMGVSGVSGVYSDPVSDLEPPSSDDCQKCGRRNWRWEPDFEPPSWVCDNCEPASKKGS